MHILFTHVVSESIVQNLTDSGRRPQNVLIMFGEEKQFADYYVAPNDPSRAYIMRRVFDYIGLPPAEEIESIAKTTVFNNRCDVLCVSGATAGVGTDMGILERVKNAVPDTAVFANTGCKVNTIEGIFKIADGAVVGTTFKKDGKFENQVELDRVKEFMDKVHSIR